jgi:hypothetical protein
MNYSELINKWGKNFTTNDVELSKSNKGEFDKKLCGGDILFVNVMCDYCVDEQLKEKWNTPKQAIKAYEIENGIDWEFLTVAFYCEVRNDDNELEPTVIEYTINK